ncbi:hypothetical protein AVEN_206299-1 [Araneus ventricosus]|uniref:Uncharacterized protein n=1 Tax=Araneus ventricosus TaxID=182803 RepID=A0A4Y2NC31_ARAVE|nr:hypothetical protein AVEN_206299-1 [Araneus ventricosus]
MPPDLGDKLGYHLATLATVTSPLPPSQDRGPHKEIPGKTERNVRVIKRPGVRLRTSVADKVVQLRVDRFQSVPWREAHDSGWVICPAGGRITEK